MRECSICYEKKDNFFTLNCCHNNLCIECSDQLRNPQCPFCRTLIIHRRFRSQSLSEENNSIEDTYYDNYVLWNYVDDLYFRSRWFRRHERRMRRLRERERLNNYNRELSRQRKEERYFQQIEREKNKRKFKKNQKREILSDFKEVI